MNTEKANLENLFKDFAEKLTKKFGQDFLEKHQWFFEHVKDFFKEHQLSQNELDLLWSKLEELDAGNLYEADIKLRVLAQNFSIQFKQQCLKNLNVVNKETFKLLCTMDSDAEGTYLIRIVEICNNKNFSMQLLQPYVCSNPGKMKQLYEILYFAPSCESLDYIVKSNLSLEQANKYINAERAKIPRKPAGVQLLYPENGDIKPKVFIPSGCLFAQNQIEQNDSDQNESDQEDEDIEENSLNFGKK